MVNAKLQATRKRCVFSRPDLESKVRKQREGIVRNPKSVGDKPTAGLPT